MYQCDGQTNSKPDLYLGRVSDLKFRFLKGLTGIGSLAMKNPNMVAVERFVVGWSLSGVTIRLRTIWLLSDYHD